MVCFKQLALALALASSTDAQFFGMSPKAMLSLIRVIPASLMTPGMTEMFNRQVNGIYGKTSGWTNAVPKREAMTPRFASTVSGSKTVKIRYGPYLVPGMMKKNGLGEGGSLWNYPDKTVEKPCEGKCALLGMSAGLEYADGSDASIDTGSWLHHFVLFNAGPGRVDATCADSSKSLPHINMAMSPTNSERLFASGNERTMLSLNWAQDGTKKPAAYHLNAADRFGMVVDLMNENDADKTYYLTITYDYLDGHPAGYDDVRPLWFDVDQCGFSEAKPLAQSGKFTLNALPWTSTVEGEILSAFGHLHDGGFSTILTVDGKPECVSEASYGTTPKYVQKTAMGHAGSATVHISNMTICEGNTGIKTMMKKGQSWGLKATYDYDKFKGVLDEDGKQSDVMGIAFVYVRQPKQ